MQRPKKDLIYLDHNATTPLAPEALEAMMPYLQEEFGNPSSAYVLGTRAREGLDRARHETASLLGCQDQEVVFTSGGSESNNTVLKGLIDFKVPEAFHVITSAVEHIAVLNPALFLLELGAQLTVVPVDASGRVDPEAVRKAILPNTKLISVMIANNETGTLQPIREISKIAREHGILFHTDAAQAVGKIGVDVNELGVDFLSVAGHKVYASKGVGALYIREGRNLTPLVHGAAQENGMRAGTENVALAVGLGAACRIAQKRLEDDSEKVVFLRNRLQDLLSNGIKGLVQNGHPEFRLPNTLNVSVPGLDGSQILVGAPNVIASTGAACHDKTVRLSHVLSAMGISPEIGMGALRFTLGRKNTLSQIEEAAQSIINQVRRMR